MAKNYTKDLIRKEFIRLLNKKKLHNITVTELAKACNIERKTFYYHYDNLTELVKEIFDEELDRVIEEFNETLSWEESFILVAKFIFDNKKVVKHIYESDYRIDLEKYIFSISGEIMRKYVIRAAKDTKAQEVDIILIAYFYQCALSSALVQWLATDMKTDPKTITRRIGELMDGNILLSLKRSEKLEKFTQNFDIE
ncbi:MAG: TetR/AcrR family transcriptional regulator C-terminal domain-containing protein [Peptoniphilus grossensis]|uniref:TetR/AcrR family transcriptional regulator n=1 Tax=Peptoniphilus grossensis TaxID=1465756 RepID=UPI002913B724|nr:TetR/AcrR family transcriptional regulator C-terminal domain-containing protein [Peptoniphilus grossensis]MDU7150923.1 TetR/AcrR family transcriptional regulator C-terminal domain-containing protein [Peptoniphilus grossensis]